MDEQKILAYISIVLGILALGFAIFLTNDTTLQIGYIVLIILSAFVYFIFENKNSIKVNDKKLKKTKLDINEINKSIDFHERLLKIENEVFKK